MLGSCWHFSFHLRPCSPPASFSMSSVRKFNRFAWRVATSKLLWCVRLTPTRSALFNVTLNAVMSGAKRSRRLNIFGFACQGAICQHYPADNGAHDHPPPRSLMTLMLKAFADFPSGQLITDVAEYQWRLSRQLCPKMGLPQTVRNFNPARPAAAGADVGHTGSRSRRGWAGGSWKASSWCKTRSHPIRDTKPQTQNHKPRT